MNLSTVGSLLALDLITGVSVRYGVTMRDAVADDDRVGANPDPRNLKHYDYAVHPDVGPIEIGDLVVVEASGQLHVAYVVATHPEPSPKATKWVIQRVDLQSYIERTRIVREARKLMAEADQLIRTEDRVARLQELSNSGNTKAGDLLRRLRTTLGATIDVERD